MLQKQENYVLNFGANAILAAACLFIVLGASGASAGNVLIAGDDWIFMNTGFSSRPIDTANFARNVAEFVTNGSGNSIHAYSNYQSLTQSSLINTLRNAGYNYTTGTNITFDLQTLSQYDAMFFGSPIPSSSQLDVLSQYVNNGGGLYIHAGLGMSNPGGAAQGWNEFLSEYGLAFGSSILGVSGNTSIKSDHPLFEGVSSLYMLNGHRITGGGVVATTSGGSPLFAAYEVPEPTTITLLACGNLSLLTRRKTS
jgi:hypothetical protein